MQETYPDRVVAVTWNLDHDNPESAPTELRQQQVLDELVESNIECENVIASDTTQDVLDHYGIFSLPAAHVFGPDGKLVMTFEGAFSYDEDVGRVVASLLE